MSIVLDEPEDIDPQCICGVYHSEHSMLGCSDGFMTPEDWERQKAAMRDRIIEDDGYIYDDEG